MLLFPAKLVLSHRFFPFKLDHHHHHNPEALSASLLYFRSKITSHILSKPENESESPSLAWFHTCFELLHIITKAFSELVAEIDYPATQWGGGATEEYLNYTLNLLNVFNSISSTLSRLNQAKISILHGLSLVESSTSSADKYLKKIGITNPGKGLEERSASIEIEIRPGSDKKESLILEALIIVKKIGLLAVGLVASGLDCSEQPCLEIGDFPGGGDDPLNSVFESRFWKEMREIEGPMVEVKEVNRAIERLSCDEGAAEELKGRLEVLENAIQGIEKEASNLFSQVIADRNKLLDNIRFMGENS